MTEPLRIEDCASELRDAARRFQSAVQQPGSHTAARESLVTLEEALQIVSAAWYQLAADAPTASNGLSRETEVQYLGTLHDVAAAFARCARVCRQGRAAAERAA